MSFSCIKGAFFAIMLGGVFAPFALSQTGFINFEEGTDASVIRSTIPGLTFTTTAGYDWIYGDWRTHTYNGPYPNGAYTSNANFFAWLGPNQGSGRIDFIYGTATFLSVLTSTYSGLTLDAYDAKGNLVGNSGWATSNINTGNMTRLTVAAPAISYIIIHDTGNYWLIDDLTTDAPGVPGQPSITALVAKQDWASRSQRIISASLDIFNVGQLDATQVNITSVVPASGIWVISISPTSVGTIAARGQSATMLNFQLPIAYAATSFAFQISIQYRDGLGRQYTVVLNRTVATDVSSDQHRQTP